MHDVQLKAGGEGQLPDCSIGIKETEREDDSS